MQIRMENDGYLDVEDFICSESQPLHNTNYDSDNCYSVIAEESSN